MPVEEEIALLEKENEMSIEELRAMYAKMEEGEQQEQKEDGVAPMEEEEEENQDQPESDENEEFIGEDEQDDETTLIEEEKLGRDITVEEEIAQLNKENDMSIEELRAMYANMEDDEEDNSAENPAEKAAKTSSRSKRRKTAPTPPPTETSANDALEKLAELDAKARSLKVTRPFIMAPSLKVRMCEDANFTAISNADNTTNFPLRFLRRRSSASTSTWA